MPAMGQREEYVEELFRFVYNEGGQCRLDKLGEKVPKPPNVKERVSQVLKQNTDKFVVEKVSGNGVSPMVHIVQKGAKYKFDDPSLCRMFYSLFRMTRLYHNRSWPQERSHWVADFADELGLTGASETLFALRNGGYVKVKEGKYLKWNLAKIKGAVNDMPEGLKTIATTRTTRAPGFQAQKEFKLGNRSTCYFIDDQDSLDAKLDADPCLRGLGRGESNIQTDSFIALDCEGVPEALELLQVATQKGVYIFDCRTLGEDTVCRKLTPLLTSTDIVKFIHDLHKDAVALDQFGSIKLEGVLDTQLVAEHFWGEIHLGFNGLLTKLELPNHPSKDFMRAQMRSGVDLWSERPIPQNYLEYAAMDVSCLRAATLPIADMLAKQDSLMLEKLIQASTLRARNAIANDGMRAICFDFTNDYSLASAELFRATRPDDGYFGEALVVESNVEEVISLLPEGLQTKFELSAPEKPPRKMASNLLERFLLPGGRRSPEPPVTEEILPFNQLSDVVLDIGRRPQCWIEDQRVFLCDKEDQLVTSTDIKYIKERLGEFGSDNRAGLDRKLHRFSAIRNRDKDISGITIRLGRHVRGNAAMLMDFLMGSDKSILILGEPGSGKTTIVREATRKLAEEKNVVVVDTSNEIAGDGIIPHACIGLARRMMVPTLDQQSAVMVECVQNHTPHVMVIDEIGRPKEVQAARTVKQRGVRMIASAHGDLRRLLKNKDLSGLVGGIESVTMGDDMAREEAKRKQQLAAKEQGENRSFSVSKTKVQRGGEPTFEVIIEVRRGSRHEWRVVADSAKAVDRILDGLHYKAQLRTREPLTGEMRLEFVEA